MWQTHAVGFALIIAESRSRDQPAGRFPQRMFEYFCQLYLRHRLPVVPIAVFSDDADWSQPIPDSFELTLSPRSRVRFDFHLIKLSQLDHRQFLKSSNPLAFALMAMMN